MKKNYIALAIGAFLCLNLMVITVNAVTMVKPIVKATSVKLSKTKDALIINKTDTLKTTITPTTATNKAVTWKSSNIKIANVDKLGKITAVSAGTATITATTIDGSKRATCIVTVTKAPTRKPVYNGSVISKKLYSLGFFKSGTCMVLNPYGSQGADQFDQASFAIGPKIDMAIAIFASNPILDAKYKTLFNWILPTKGNTLSSILDNPKVKTQTIELDGRTVFISVETHAINIDFGPVK